MSQCSESSERSELWGKTGARTKNRPSPRHWGGQSAEKALCSPDRRHLLLRLVINRKFTFMILSPVLRIPSWPAGPFSEIFEIKIPCKRQQKNIALHTATRVSPTILPILGTSLPPRRMTPTWKGREACLKIELNSWRPSYRTNDLLQPVSL